MGNCGSKLKGPESIKFEDESDEEKFNEGKPVFLEQGLKVRKNLKTNKLEGIPKQWLTHLKVQIPIDESKIVESNQIKYPSAADQEFPSSILRIIDQQPSAKEKSQSSLFSLPDFGEVSFDTSSPKNANHDGFIIFSDKWNESLATSFESPSEIEDPQALTDIMAKAEDELKQSTQEKLVLSSQEFEKKIGKVKFIEAHPTKNFIFREELGHGGVCTVYKTEARFAHNTYYAVRIMKIIDPDMLKKIKCEIAVMQLCANSYIVQYHFTYYYRQSLFMFIEYMDAGCLTKFIHYYLKSIPENVMAYILRRILKGLASLHQRKQIHRDLKSDNILLNHRGEIKIADFGYALQLTSEKLNALGPAGTAAWMAPELIMKVQYDQMADIWSLGMIVLELCNGQPPYLRMKPLRAMYKVASSDPPVLSGVSPQLASFTSCCLKKNPKQRSTTHELLQHPFIKKIGQGSNEKQMFKKMLRKYL